jgi:L-aspartate semialdehyde sulfurtransferase ferredoxin
MAAPKNRPTSDKTTSSGPRSKSGGAPASSGPAAKSAKSSGAGKTSPDQTDKMRLWLMYPPKLITTPVIWELGHKFQVQTNVRQASVTDEIGIVCLELEGKRSEIKSAINWLETMGVSVEPVEINVIES